jgi:hypothetical protein
MTLEIRSPYDEWPPKQAHRAPLISSRWQDELNRIAGFAPNGWPRLKLEWGGTATWTPYVRNLKYLYAVQTKTTGWGVHVKNDAGDVISTLTFPVDSRDIPEPSPRYGIAFPLTEEEEIGIPRFWITQYTPPSLLGSWEEARFKVNTESHGKLDMGQRPNEGMYYLGFHGIWHHEGGECCKAAQLERRKCFGYFREPSDLDMLYVKSLWREMEAEGYQHDWTESAQEKHMLKQLQKMYDDKQKVSKQERTAMKLRIRDAFKSHKAKITSRKGKDTWIFTPYDNNMPGTSINK